jgi:hypothetical protein
MPLDGLRAWIGEVERKLGMRTRVFLVLTVIAIGGAGAAIYLAIEARNDSVSEADVQALQEKLEARIDEGGATGSTTPEAEPEAPQPEGEAAPGGGGGGGAGSSGGGSGSGGSGGSGGGGGASTGAGGNGGGSGTSSGSGSGASTNGGAPKTKSGSERSAGLAELIQKAKEKNEQIENSKGK